MKIALASVKFINKNIKFNIENIEKFSSIASENGADLIVFGETFIQGFDGLSWNYEADKEIAITQESIEMQKIKDISSRYKIDIMTGYIELENDGIYSSEILLSGNKVIHNYRRVSKGWKEECKTDFHYKEGKDTSLFMYKNKKLSIALCGDLWDEETVSMFNHTDILIWPVYINFNEEEWINEIEDEYAAQASVFAYKTLMVNSITEFPDEESLGGAFLFEEGKVKERFYEKKEGLLYIDISCL